VSRRLVLDTDMGSDVDDALCLALGLASPELEFNAVTTVGNESAERARISKRLLELGGAPGVPVFAGCRVPVLAGARFNWFGHEGEGILEPGRAVPIEDEHAVDALLRLSREEPLEIVAVGPMTNLAVALMKDPDFAGRVRSLTIMGGHIRHVEYGGHVFAPGVDYNLCADPEASYLVLRSGMPIRLVTADVTLQTRLTSADLARLEAVDSPFHRALCAAVRIWTPVQRRLFGRAGCEVDDDCTAFLHDPLTLAVLYDESLCSFETLEIAAAIEDGVFRTFERERPGDDSAPIRCAVAVDAEAARQSFVDRVVKFRPAA
jgi:purine nucleosidase